MFLKSKIPYIRDVYLASLIDGANRTQNEGFPLIEDWMVAKDPPKDLIQWNRKTDVRNFSQTGLCFYCDDYYFKSFINNPEKYIPYLKKFNCVIGLDASPYDNMPSVVQNSQIFVNLALTYFLGKNGIKIIPNVRLGTEQTYPSLNAYPKNTLISIGTNGFTRNLENREIFRTQIELIISKLKPTGIIVYGPVTDYLFPKKLIKNIPIYQYDSYMMKRNRILRRCKYER